MKRSSSSLDSPFALNSYSMQIVWEFVLYGMNPDQENTVLQAYFGRKLLPEELYKFQKMKSFAGIFYGFALVGISQMQGEAFISETDIESLPSLREMHSDGDKIFPMGIQRFGFALLREALR